MLWSLVGTTLPTTNPLGDDSGEDAFNRWGWEETPRLDMKRVLPSSPEREGWEDEKEGYLDDFHSNDDVDDALEEKEKGGGREWNKGEMMKRFGVEPALFGWDPAEEEWHKSSSQ